MALYNNIKIYIKNPLGFKIPGKYNWISWTPTINPTTSLPKSIKPAHKYTSLKNIILFLLSRVKMAQYQQRWSYTISRTANIPPFLHKYFYFYDCVESN